MNFVLTRSLTDSAAILCAAAQLASSHAPVARAAAQLDPIAIQIARWTAVVKNETPTDELWAQIKAGAQTELERAEQALCDGRRWFALERFAAV